MIQSRLTCDSPDLPFEESADKTRNVSPEADADEVEVLQFAPLFLFDLKSGSINQSILNYSKFILHQTHTEQMQDIYLSSHIFQIIHRFSQRNLKASNRQIELYAAPHIFESEVENMQVINSIFFCCSNSWVCH